MEINLLHEVTKRIDKCYEQHGEYASFAEAMSILREEFEELWQECKRKELDFTKIKTEIIDVMTVLIKGYEDVIINNNIL